jgi:hypothetical protein
MLVTAEALMAGEGLDAASVIADKRLKDGYAYWHGKRGARTMPRRSDIDPIEIPHLLPYIRLVDVLEAGRFRYRLVGTEARTHHSVNPTGRYVDEMLSPPAGLRILALYAECARECRAVYVEHEFILTHGSGIPPFSKVLFTPLSEDGTTVSQILAFHVIAALPPEPRQDGDIWMHPYREIVHAAL